MIPNVSLNASPRETATALNFLLNKRLYPFPALAAAPANPKEGCTYFDTVLNVVRTYGTDAAWHDHW